jgi:hypothetical protein
MNAQEALWYPITVIGPGWWLLCSAFALPAAVLLFLTMIMNEKMSALLLSRVLILGSLVCFGLIPLNSGWMPYGVMFASVGGLLTTVLIATKWCDRTDKWEVLRRLAPRRNRSEHAHARGTLERNSQ